MCTCARPWFSSLRFLAFGRDRFELVCLSSPLVREFHRGREPRTNRGDPSPPSGPLRSTFLAPQQDARRIGAEGVGVDEDRRGGGAVGSSHVSPGGFGRQWEMEGRVAWVSQQTDGVPCPTHRPTRARQRNRSEVEGCGQAVQV